MLRSTCQAGKHKQRRIRILSRFQVWLESSYAARTTHDVDIATIRVTWQAIICERDQTMSFTLRGGWISFIN
jgi:hypothetical protein